MTDDVTDNIVVRGCLGSIPSWVLKKEKKEKSTHLKYVLYILYVYMLFLFSFLRIQPGIEPRHPLTLYPDDVIRNTIGHLGPPIYLVNEVLFIYHTLLTLHIYAMYIYIYNMRIRYIQYILHIRYIRHI